MTTSIRSGTSDAGILINGVEELTIGATTPPTTANAQGSGVSELTRKDYVDGVAIGVGQTWQDKIGSRANATNYTSPATRSIQVIIGGSGTSSSSITLTVGGVVVNITQGQSASSIPYSVQAIVPPNTVYRIDTSGSVTSLTWKELTV